MRIVTTIRDFIDIIIEEVAIKTGILLNDYDVKELIKSSDMGSWEYIFEKPQDEYIGVRPELIEEFVCVLRASLGNLPNASTPLENFINTSKELFKEGIDIEPVIKAISEIIESNKYEILGKETAQEIADVTRIDIRKANKIIQLLVDFQDRSIDVSLNYDQKKWDGVIPLSKLFEGEITPDNPELYFDQKFLDYLAANEENISKIHWRNFERLCAEHFKRLRYKVSLGPGKSDGGIDIRIWPEEKNDGPPLILIQCKRYQEGKSVSIEYVKAFWSDIVFEKAESGLIITSSCVSPGGHKICQARKWPITIDEIDKVKEMVKGHWKHPWNGKNKKKISRKYYLPPIVFFDNLKK